jgi:hypothetical protein
MSVYLRAMGLWASVAMAALLALMAQVAWAAGDGKPRVLNIPELGTGVFDCSPNGEKGYPKCSDIPVIVVQTGTGCASLLPYNELKVHVGPKKEKVKVTWVLVAPEGYTFSDSPEAELAGIALLTPGGTYVKDGHVSGNKRKYAWTVKAHALPLVSGHQATVMPPNSSTPCIRIDPRIVNEE